MATQLGATTLAEAETLVDAARAYAAERLQLAAGRMRALAGELEEIAASVPAAIPEHAALLEPMRLLRRYADLIGEQPAAEQADDTALGRARRVSQGVILRQYNERQAEALVAWARDANFPPADMAALQGAFYVERQALADLIAAGNKLNAGEMARLARAEAATRRQASLSAALADHYRRIDALQTVEEARAYPAAAVWP